MTDTRGKSGSFRERLYRAAARAALVPNNIESLVEEVEAVADEHETLEEEAHDLRIRILALYAAIGAAHGSCRVCARSIWWLPTDDPTLMLSYSDDGTEHFCRTAEDGQW